MSSQLQPQATQNKILTRDPQIPDQILDPGHVHSAFDLTHRVITLGTICLEQILTGGAGPLGERNRIRHE